MADSRFAHVLGDAHLDEPTARQLAGFIRRNRVEVVRPARWPGWIWSARIGDAVDRIGEHEPIRLVTVVKPAPIEVVRQVACLTMRGLIDHVMTVAPRQAAVVPMASPDEMRDSVQKEACEWWACPFRATMRCTCVPSFERKPL